MPLFTRRAPDTLNPIDNWQDKAACRNLARPNIMFPGTDKFLLNEARKFCDRCPVRLECLSDGFATNDRHGVRAGSTPQQRARMTNRMNKEGGTLAEHLARAVVQRNLDLGEELDNRTVEDADGHTRWTSGTTSLELAGQVYTPMQLAFTVGYDRAPIGTVRAACGVNRCLTPDHLTDGIMREQRPRGRAAA
jgi:hypothetical protein